MRTHLTVLTIACTVSLTLTGCATTPKGEPSPQQLYAEGDSAFQKSRYELAVETWKKVRDTFPEPELAAKAEIGIANAYFLNKDYIEAGAAYAEFRRLHPTHDLAQFALYRQAQSSYELITGIDTDQTPTKNAMALFEQFVRDYPTSQYAVKSQEKIADCRNKLAAYEVYVGSFYQRTGHPEAAIGRLEGALSSYPDYQGHDETLLLLGKAYRDTKQPSRMQSVVGRLVREYPASKYLSDGRALLATTP